MLTNPASVPIREKSRSTLHRKFPRGSLRARLEKRLHRACGKPRYDLRGPILSLVSQREKIH